MNDNNQRTMEYTKITLTGGLTAETEYVGQNKAVKALKVYSDWDLSKVYEVTYVDTDEQEVLQTMQEELGEEIVDARHIRVY